MFTQDMVVARTPTPSIQRKCWFFCHGVVMRLPCSRSREHDTTSPLTQTRRAAWRRSERRKRRQRRRRALVRQSAGRRSKVRAASSLRLRMTSLTASHGPAASKSSERIAMRFDTPALPHPRPLAQATWRRLRQGRPGRTRESGPMRFVSRGLAFWGLLTYPHPPGH